MYLYIIFELGGAVLALEDAWLAVAICRSKIMKGVDGGVAQLVGKILALMLPEFSTTGLFCHRETAACACSRGSPPSCRTQHVCHCANY